MAPLERTVQGFIDVMGETEPFIERPLLKGKRILVVDKEEFVCRSAKEMLERYGCIVEMAHQGANALGRVKLDSTGQASYDVIISDLGLPDMSGYDLLLQLKQLMDRVPLILMTDFGYDRSVWFAKARHAGLHPRGMLFKPFRSSQLLGTVEAMIIALAHD